MDAHPHQKSESLKQNRKIIMTSNHLHRGNRPSHSRAIGICIFYALAAFAVSSCGEASPNLPLVKGGQPTSVLILPAESEGTELRDTAEDFAKIVQRSTGAQIPIIEEASEAPIPEGVTRIYLGRTQEADKAGLSSAALPEEGYRISTKENRLFVIGNSADSPSSSLKKKPISRPILWALNSLLEKQIGVRWLWPGELGTYVPRKSDLIVPSMDVTYQPKLEWRSLWLPKSYSTSIPNDVTETRLQDEALQWVENHQAGRRSKVKFGHNFLDWWDKYGKTHPDYFGETMPGIKQPWPRAGRVKLRLANPAVIEQIAMDYQAAGSPAYWNICPNDGSYFDISKETREWDIPKDQPIEEIWTAKANLTARYVKFWNLIYARLREINPDVVLCTYAYSAYKSPPPAERPLTANMAIALVHSYNDHAAWKAWGANGTMLFLRPNWWHYGSNGPNLPLKQIADFLKFAWDNGMHGILMDSILGYWGTQSPSYYLVARLMTRPDLSEEEILTEYASAFGAATPKIREYLDYWQKVSMENAYMSPQGRFVQLMNEKKISTSVTRGSREALPFLYPEEIVVPAYQILDEAALMVQTSDPEAAGRVAFLQHGLDELRATRDLVSTSSEAKRDPNAVNMAKFNEQSNKLEELRRQLTSSHVIWGHNIDLDEDNRGVFVKPRVQKPVAADTDEI